MTNRVAKWLIFSLLLALVPFLIARGVHLLIGTEPFYWYYLWQRGELCLIAASLSVVGIGDLLDIKPVHKTWAIVCGGFAALTALASASLFGILNAFGTGIAPGPVNGLSLTLLPCGIVAGLSCHILAGLSDSADRSRP